MPLTPNMPSNPPWGSYEPQRRDPKNPHLIEQIAHELTDEIAGDAGELGPLMVDELLPGQVRASEQQIVSLFQKKWEDLGSPDWVREHPDKPFWRQEKLHQIGPKKFSEYARKAFDAAKPLSPRTLAQRQKEQPIDPASPAGKALPPKLLPDLPEPAAPPPTAAPGVPETMPAPGAY